MAYKCNVCIVWSIFVIIVYVAWRNQFRSDVCTTTAKRIFVSNIPCVCFVFISFFSSHFMFESLGFYVWVLCESVKLRMFHRYQECGLMPKQIDKKKEYLPLRWRTTRNSIGSDDGWGWVWYPCFMFPMKFLDFSWNVSNYYLRSMSTPSTLYTHRSIYYININKTPPESNIQASNAQAINI